MQQFLIGLGIGAILSIVILIAMAANNHKKELQYEKEISKLKNILTDRMDIESEGVNKLKKDLEDVKTKNENLRITVSTYSQKPGRREIARLHVYQLAADRLTLNSPGFGAVWQASLKESEEEFEKTFRGIHPFLRKIVPIRTDAQVINQIEDR